MRSPRKHPALLCNTILNAGYPTKINIDYDSQIADEEEFLTIENLQSY
ncbi:MAG: hypothetical protein KME22_09430 [Hassallia sp. WJT32-NPBG1]|jgi:hypothetical protein|nr:hypothetical protein [Hassallia sp. WJT32-NPBG1]